MNILRSDSGRNSRSRRSVNSLAQLFFIAVLALTSGHAVATPEIVDWDTLTWTPEGPTNLSETFPIGLSNFTVTYGGNTASLDNSGSPISPSINSQNEGALVPVENSLYVGVDHADNSNSQVSITFDFSNYPGGVSNISFTMFDIDNGSTFVDEAEVTAVNGTGTINPTTLINSPSNAVIDANSIEGTNGSPATGTGSGDANATFVFAQSGITSVTIVYYNNIGTTNPGFQWMNIHDISFDAPRADIEVQKSVDNINADVGDTVVFTVTATNNGPDASAQVDILDQLPAGYTYVSDNGGGSYNTGTGIWSAGAFTNGQVKTLDITATINATGPYANTASLDFSAAADTDLTNNTETVTLTPSPVSDLSLTKAVSNAEPLIGSNVTFTLTVDNAGPSTTTNVAISDQLPSGYSFVTSTPSTGTYSNGTGIWTVGTMANGATETLDIVATVLATGTYNNTAQVSASDSMDPDSTPNNNVEAEDDQQTVSVTPPQIGTAKTISAGPVNNGDGSYTLTYSVLIENNGSSALNNVQLVDSLATTFTGASFTVDTVTSATFATNAGYNGNADTNVLAGTDTLAIGASGTVAITVTVSPGGNLGPYNNSATANATSPGGTAVSDVSQNGADVDPDNDGNSGNNNVATPVSFAEAPEIGTAKAVSAGPTNNGDGTYTWSYTVLVENTGDVPLSSLQVTDNLNATFGAATFVVDSVSSPDFAVNAGFNGNGDTNLLAGTDTLTVAATGTITLTVTVTPGANFGPYNNSANATGTSPGGTGVNDVSQDGTDVDPDGDGNPGNNSTPTPVTITEAPEIGVAKAVSAGPTNNGDGTYSLTYSVLVENTGDIVLSSVQVVDDLTTTFAGATFAVDSVSSGTLAANAGFNGAGNTNLLAGTDTLAVGASGTVLVNITVTPGANLGPYNNTATGNGTSPGGAVVNDTSQDGANVDPDGDGNPGNNSVPTPVSFTENPEIGTAKDVTAGPTNNGDGTYTLTYTINVENTGDVPLESVQVTDNLNTTFSGATFAVNTVTSATFAINGGFNGAGDTNLLTGADTLASGASGTIAVTLTVTPGTNLGPYNNAATASGASASGTGVSDISTDGANVDPDGDGNPGNNTVPTPVTFAEAPEIGAAKALTAGPTNNGDGTYSLTYTIIAENTGDVPLDNVQLTEVLTTTFAGATFTVDSLTSGTLTVNGGFNGIGDTSLLAGSDSLAVGASGTAVLSITVTPGGNLGPYDNTVTAAGTSPGGTGVNDVSQDGANVDPDGDGNPGNNSVPTPVSFTESPEIGTAKQITAGPVNNGDGTHTLTYTIVVENTGDVPLNNVQAVDNLATTFTGATFVVDSITSGTLSANAGFNGGGDTNLLDGTDTLAVGASGTVVVAVTVTPGANLGLYNNTATGSGSSPSGVPVSDDSQDGANVDPDGDGNPGNNNVPTPVTFTEMPEIGVAKAVTAGPTPNGDGSSALTYTITVENTGDVVLDSLQVVDDLAATYATAVGFSVTAISSPDFAVDVGFDGNASTDMLAGTDTLAVGASGTIVVSINVTAGANLGPYDNTAVASGDGPSGTTATDDSTDGANVDPDGDGNPGNNSVPTPANFTENPQLGSAKSISSPITNNGNGTFTFTYSILVDNTGDVPLDSIQVTDDLTTTFAGATGFVVDSVTSADFAANPAFDGNADTDVLVGTDVLAPGVNGTVDVTVTVTPGANLGPYNNTAQAAGKSAANTGVTDDSQLGTNVDPDGDGNPGNNSDPTPVSFNEAPEIGVAKEVASGPTSNGDGSFSLSYTILVENTGDVALNSLQVVEDLDTTFATATSYSVDSVSSGDFTVNPGFDGSANTNLLTGGDTLVLAATGTITLAVTVTPGGDLGPYNNIATGNGTSPGGTPVSDISTDGNDVDPDGSGGPGNNSTPTPVTFVESPEIGAAKSITAGPTNNGDGTYTLTYTILAENSGDVDLSGVQIVDDLSTTFAVPATFIVDSVTSPDFAINAGYNGAADTDLLTGAGTLTAGSSGTVLVTLTVTPGANLGPYDNTATASGTSPGGAPVSDDSEDGADPDPDADGSPGNNSTPTPATFAETPEIGVAKAVTAGPTSNGDGTASLTYTVTVENTGDVTLNNVQVVEDLATTFAGATGFTVDGNSSGVFAVNGGFDGSGDTNLLTGADTLAPGASGTILVTVTVQPGMTLGPYDNTATGNATSPAGTPVTDDSTDGANVDPDGNGNPGDNSDPTPVTFAEMPEIGLAKTVSTAPAANGDGTATLTYTLTVVNSGDVDLENVQVTDSLATTFGAATSWTVDSITSATLTTNGGFDGDATTDLLAGTDTLAIGASATIDIVVTVEPGANLGPYDNTATATGSSPAGMNATDDSQDGTVPDSDGDGDPTNNSDPTPVSFVEMPSVGLAKSVSTAPINNGDGTFTLTYTLTVDNTGDVALSALQVTDDLNATFAGATSFVVDSTASTDFTVNAGYNGAADTDLLDGTDTLATGATGTVDITVTVTPGANPGPYDNTATAMGNSPAGTPTSDISQSGANVDPDGDGDPGNNSDPTPISFNESPEIGAAKALSAGPTSNGNGTFSLAYSVVVENTGDVALSAVQLVENFDTTFATATAYSVDSVTSADLAANAGFDGSADTNLLDGTDTLAVGANGTVVITVTVTPGADLGPYNNDVTAAGTSPAGTPVSDLSTDGTDVDPDGDGNPGNNSDPTPVTFAEMPEIGVAKTISASPVDNGDGTSTLTYSIVVENTGDVDLNTVQVVEDLTTTFAGATTFAVDSLASADFAVNVAFDGSANADLLTGADTLAPAASGVITLTVTVTPGNNLGPYNNTAVANALSPSASPVTDDSTDGTDVDPDGDGNPGNNMDPTPVTFAESPVIGTAKTISTGPTDNGDGSFTLNYSVTVSNLGNVPLTSVQLVDDLAATFPGLTVTVDSVTSATLATNAGYNGAADTNVLAGTDTLAVASTATVDITVTVVPGANLGPYNNLATASGLSPAATPVSDDSTDGTDPDPDGDGDPGNNMIPTPVTFTEMPELGVAKSVSSGPTDNGDGSFTLTYNVTVQNTGATVLDNLQVTDSLAATYATATSFTVDTTASTNLTVNAAYDGDTDTNLLAGTDSLAIGGSESVAITVTVVPGGNLGPYNNTADANGVSPSGTPVSDTSQSGSNPDPDGDGNPGNNSDPTPVNFSESPQLGTAKSATVPVDNSDGTFTLTYTITLTNSGNVALSLTNIIEDLSTTYATATSFTVDSVTSTDFTANPAFDGAADTNLLAGADVLAVGASGSVDVVVTIEPGADLGPYNNTAVGTGQSPAGTPVSDDSTDGNDPDPDGDSDPSNNSTPTPTTFTESPEIGVAKSISSGPVDNGNGTFAITYTVRVENTGSTPLSNVQATDDLATTFTGATGFVVDGVSSTDFTVNAAYDGAGDVYLLAATDTLAVGAFGTVDVMVTVTPGANLGPYDNSAIGTGDSPSSTTVTDTSQSGADVDPDGDGDPGNNSDPTSVNFSESPILGTAKAVTVGPTNNGDGSFTLTYTIALANTGNVALSNLQIVDSLAATYAAATSFMVDSVTSTDFAANAAYDGSADTNVLAGTDTLAVGGTGTVDVVVTVTPGANAGPYNNLATGSGTTPSGTPVTDDSTDGTNPDPDSDGNPANNSDPTPISFMENPQLGVAKLVSSAPVDNGDGTISLSYQIAVENTGDVALNMLQVSDSLATTFTGVTSVTVAAVTSADFTVNPAYDGDADASLLAGSDSLAVGGTGSITVDVTVVSGGAVGPYNNTATASGVSPADITVTDDSTDGADNDPDNDGDPNNNSVPTPVTLPLPVAALSGNAWLDADIDDMFDATEQPLEGWIIELVQNGTVIQTINVAADGSYSATGLVPGMYDIRLRNPINMATFGLIEAVDLPPGTTVIDQNLPIDPSGVVYDSDTRAPIAGATVTLVDSNGNALPDACLLPNQQPQTTDASGAYRFDVNLGADPACPSGGVYTITVISPTGYLDAPSSVIQPQAGPLVATGGPNPFTVVPQQTAPQIGEATVYYFDFMLSNGDPDIINNHIPLDPPMGVADIRLTKASAKKQVVVGELVPYTITAENIGAVPATGVVISDMLPPGFSYVENSATLNGAGTLTVTGQRPVEFGGIDMPIGGTATVTYVLRVGAGVTQGEYTNTATPFINGVAAGTPATARVAVISDPDFEQTTIIGKVFNDINGDGYQDEDEFGIPGVRLGTVEGLLVETDANGRYHLAGIEGGRFDRGRNFIVKVDAATLPDGATFSTENPRVKRITQGLMNRFDFGVQLPDQQSACCERVSVKLGEVFFVDDSAEISPRFMPMLDQLADRLVEHGGGRLVIDGNDACDAPAQLPVTAPEEISSYTLTPRFGVRKANLQTADKAELERIAGQWSGASNIQVKAIGHTSNVRIAPQHRNEFKDNYELSRARAQSVGSYLQSLMNLGSGQVSTSGMGPDQPVASNSTASGRAKNRRVELQITGSRGQIQQVQPATACNSDLAKQRARNVLEALKQRMGKDMIDNIDIKIGGAVEDAPQNESAVPSDTVSENHMEENTFGVKLRHGLATVMGLLVTSAHAAEMPMCTIDSCLTEDGYAIQINSYTDDRPADYNDTPVAISDNNRVDISGDFLIRLPGGGVMWATEDPAVVDPRMAVHTHDTLPVTAGAVTQPVDFWVYKNYDAFIDRIEVLVFHEDDIDRIAPIATLPVGEGDLAHVQWNGKANRQVHAGDEVFFVVQAFDANGHKDATAEKSILAVPAFDYEGPSTADIPRLGGGGASNGMDSGKALASAASTPLNGRVLVMQPERTQPQTESTAFRLTPHFDSRKTNLKRADVEELDRIIADWRGAANLQVFAEGHTDSIRIAPQNRHEFANNQVLSEARANRVAQYVASGLGVPATAIKVVGYGPKRPVADNGTASGRAKNRRVELTVSGDRPALRSRVARSRIDLIDPVSRQWEPVRGSVVEALNLLNGKIANTGDLSTKTATGRASGLDCAMAQSNSHQVHAVYGRNELVKQNIPMYGSRVRLHGQDIENNYAMSVNGNIVPLDEEGKFAVDYMLPVGEHAMNVEFMDNACTIRDTGQLNVDVSGKHMFIVALADFTLSNNDISGSLEPLSVDDRFDDDFISEGRLAFYLKGKVKGKYLLTAQLDTKEEELGDLLDNLDAKDPTSIFRRLDPDRYYPVYGDDSTTIADTDSIGKMYLRADWDKSRAVWGNFHTGYTGTEFTQYNRSLYGGQFDWHSLRTNAQGDSRTDLNLFVSENQTELGHSEFRGTGGSLYYLRHTDLLPGSEKVRIELRDRDSARVLENITLTRGVDYEVDELQGRIMLARPLMQIAQLQGPSLIKDAPLDGNDTILIADYEYIPSSFNADHVSTGIRGRHWFGDHFALGGTYVEEGRGSGSDYTLMGAEMVLQASDNTYLKAEFADTESSQTQRFFSNNGGLNFDQLGPVNAADDRSGDAFSIEGRLNSKETFNTENEWVMAAWYRNTSEGFSIARRDDGFEVTESGAEIVGRVGQKLSLTGRMALVEREGRGDDASISLQADYQLSDYSTLSGEVRRVEEERPTFGIDGEGSLAALRYTRRIGERWEVYAQGQVTLDNDDGEYDNNDMGTVGVVAKLNDRTHIIGEYSSGHRGDGASLTLDYELNHRHRVYGTYTHSADRTDTLANDQIGIGQRSRISDQLTVFNEHQFSEYREYSGVGHVFGLEFAPSPGWSLALSYQTGDLETQDGQIDRDSLSGTLAYQGDKVRWSTKLEFRDDSGPLSDQEQFVTSNRVDYKLSENTRLLGRFNHSETDDTLGDTFNARFTEAQVGMAYRPVYNDRLNMLAKYTYLYDLRGFDQIQTGPDQRSNVFAVEGIYRLNRRWDLGGKYAFRKGELRTDRDTGDWFESTTSLYAIRGRYHLIRRWDAMLEYRVLDVEEAGSTRNGWLVSLDRHFGDHMKLGLGYNFTDYSDDLTNLDYDQKGFFLNAVGKY